MLLKTFVYSCLNHKKYIFFSSYSITKSIERIKNSARYLSSNQLRTLFFSFPGPFQKGHLYIIVIESIPCSVLRKAENFNRQVLPEGVRKSTHVIFRYGAHNYYRIENLVASPSHIGDNILILEVLSKILEISSALWNYHEGKLFAAGFVLILLLMKFLIFYYKFLLLLFLSFAPMDPSGS